MDTSDWFRTPFRASPKYALTALALLVLSLFLFDAFVEGLLPAQFDPGRYEEIDILTDFLTVVASLSLFSIAWYTYPQSKDKHILFLGCVFLAIGLIELMHVINEPGMIGNITQNSENKEHIYRIMARLFSAAALLASAFVYPDSASKWLSKNKMLAAAIAFPAMTFLSVNCCPQYLPDPSEAFGLYSKYLAIALFAATLLFYWQRFTRTKDDSNFWLLAAIILYVFSEVALPLYDSAIGEYDTMDHIYKLIAFLIMYETFIITSIKRPYAKIENYNRLLKNAYYRLSGLDRLRENFVRISGHELKTPLVPILGYAEMLKNSKGLTKKQRKYAGIIYDNSLRTINLSKKLFDISKVKAGSMALSLKDTDPCRIIEKTYDERKQYSNAKKIMLRMNVQKGMPNIRIDPKKIGTVLGNLADNALKFTDKKGEIELGAEYRPGTEETAFWVKDNGIGIEKKNIKKIFNEFYQASSALPMNFEGSGIGLSICKGIVLAHGGKIWAESEYGKGAKFIFTIPASGNL